LTSIIFIFILIFTSLQGIFQVSTYPIVKKIEKRRILNEFKGYKTLNVDHFYIKYHEGDKKIANITGEVLEKHYDEVCSKLNYFPKNKIPVIIYYNEEQFKNILNIKGEKAPLGAYYCGIVNILSPNKSGLYDKQIENIYEEMGPHLHEFVHYIVDGKTKGNYPMWLTEGIALYMEETILGLSWDLGSEEASKIGVLYLNDNFNKIKVEVAYRKSYEIVKGLINNYGFEGMNQMLDNLGQGRSIKKSVKTAFKVNLEDID